MSVPIETNTEELRDILQTVYNLPNAGGGSAEPDLVITPDENFRFAAVTSSNADYNVSKISFDPDAVISTYEKLIAGKDVRVVFTGRMMLNSAHPHIMTNYHAMRALAYDTDVVREAPCLVVRFMCANSYFFLSGDGGWSDIEYRFRINSDTREVSLYGAACWTA